jgi:hypothetical protein
MYNICIIQNFLEKYMQFEFENISKEAIFTKQVRDTQQQVNELQKDLDELNSDSAYTPIDLTKLKEICKRNNFETYASAQKREEIDVNAVKKQLSYELNIMKISLKSQKQRLQTLKGLNSEGSLAESTDAKPNKKLAKALLILGLLLAVSSAAVLVALYMPNHMPTVINDIVTNLSPFYHDLILGCAYGAGALGLVGALYKGTEIYKEKPLTFYFFGEKENNNVKESQVDSNYIDVRNPNLTD